MIEWLNIYKRVGARLFRDIRKDQFCMLFASPAYEGFFVEAHTKEYDNEAPPMSDVGAFQQWQENLIHTFTGTMYQVLHLPNIKVPEEDQCIDILQYLILCKKDEQHHETLMLFLRMLEAKMKITWGKSPPRACIEAFQYDRRDPLTVRMHETLIRGLPYTEEHLLLLDRLDILSLNRAEFPFEKKHTKEPHPRTERRCFYSHVVALGKSSSLLSLIQKKSHSSMNTHPCKKDTDRRTFLDYLLLESPEPNKDLLEQLFGDQNSEVREYAWETLRVKDSKLSKFIKTCSVQQYEKLLKGVIKPCVEMREWLPWCVEGKNYALFVHLLETENVHPLLLGYVCEQILIADGEFLSEFLSTLLKHEHAPFMCGQVIASVISSKQKHSTERQYEMLHCLITKAGTFWRDYVMVDREPCEIIYVLQSMWDIKLCQKAWKKCDHHFKTFIHALGTDSDVDVSYGCAMFLMDIQTEELEAALKDTSKEEQVNIRRTLDEAEAKGSWGEPPLKSAATSTQ